jgi:hypothetical protein
MRQLHASVALVLALAACGASQTPDQRTEADVAAMHIHQDDTRERMQAITDAENKADRERFQQAHEAAAAPRATAAPAVSAAPEAPGPVDDVAGVGGLPPIKRSFVITPEKCAALTPQLATDLENFILSAPLTPGDSYKDDPLPKLRGDTNTVRQAVAVARKCITPGDAWKIQNPRGTWLGAASEADIERHYADAEGWAARLDAEIDRTQTCVMTPGCMAARKAADVKEVLDPVCQLIAQRAKDVRDIARERANPSGVVDLHLLHQIGEEIQWIDNEEMPARKARYTAEAHKPFSAALCK